jgi:adenylate kinase
VSSNIQTNQYPKHSGPLRNETLGSDMRIVLLGPAGAGKGTQAQMLAKQLGIAHIASGDLFRYHQEQGTELGLLAKRYMERGELVPDDVTIRMVLDRLSKDGCLQGFILDGFPRTLEQAVALDTALGEQNVNCVLSIQVNQEILIKRLSGRIICRQCQSPYHRSDAPPSTEGRCDKCKGELYQRTDDQPEVVERRIRIQAEQLAQLIEHYAQQAKLQSIQGEGKVSEVSKRLMEALSRCNQ